MLTEPSIPSKAYLSARLTLNLHGCPLNPRQSPRAPLRAVPSYSSTSNYKTCSKTYGNVVDSLITGAYVERATTSKAVLSALAAEDESPNVVLVADAGLSKAAISKLIEFNRNGGTVIFGCMFSSFITMDKLDKLWADWGLPWKRGDYHRTTVHLNELAKGNLRSNLLSAYSQKALFLKNVDSTAALYLPSSESTIESHVFPGGPVNHLQAAVVWSKVGSGWLGYLGDVNNEDGSQKAILAMCGL